MNRDVVRQITSIASLGMALTLNAMANILPINGRATGEISNSFPNYFVPAGFTFSIWSLIYLGLMAFVVYQALPTQKTDERVRSIGWWFVASNFANSAWILIWQYNQVVLSLLVMLALFGCLFAIYTRLDHDRASVRGAQRWLVNAPFSLYFGWITVATIVNVSVALISVGWDGAGISPELWSVALLVVGTVIGALVALPRRDWLYAGVLVWAFFGIGAKFATLALLANAAYIAAAAVAIVLLWSLFRDFSGSKLQRSSV